jgi:hypothetical protein
MNSWAAIESQDTSGYDAASFYPVLRGSAARRHGLESIAEARF